MKPKLHPELARVQDIWSQIRILKEEERAKYPSFMIKLPHESPQSMKDREDSFRRGFINPSTRLLRAKGDAVFRRQILRKGMSQGQEAFVKQADRSGQSLQEMIQNEVAPSLAAYGTVFAVMDKPSAKVETKAEELAQGRPYLTILNPFQPVNFAYGADGALLWFQYIVDAPWDNTDPFNPKRADGWKGDKGLATWTRETFSIRSLTQAKQFYVPETNHTLGIVPVIIQALYVEPNQTIGTSTFFTSSDYLIMGNNLKNASNQEVFKNADATLTMDEEDWDDDMQPRHERNPDTNLRQLAKDAHDKKNVLLYKQHKPEYLARDLDLIDKANANAMEYFEMVAENERSALSVQSLKTPQSGVSKGYDFIDVNDTLATFATGLERFDRQAMRMAGVLLEDEKEPELAYPRSFDTRDFSQRLDFVKGLKDVALPSPTGRREAFKTLTAEISTDAKVQAAINAEIDAAPIDLTPPAAKPFPPAP